MKYSSISNIGLVRDENQDYYAVEKHDKAFLAVVCDGIGGGNAGALASKMAVESLVTDFKKHEKFEDLQEVSAWFGDAITKANFEIFEKSNENENFEGMGTTMIALVLLGNKGFSFNIGDSRLYRYQGSNLKQLSHDQTYAYEMFRQNRITEEEIDSHPKRNVLMNAVGIDRQIRYEVIEVDQGWDQILLSSDGLHGYVKHEDIENALKLESLDQRKTKLMQLAYQEGARDNVTLILIEGDGNE